MEAKEFMRKTVVEAARLLVGVVFIFSGTVKAIDPVGGAIKIGEYLASFGLDWLGRLDLLFSIGLSAVEFALGVCVLLGVYRRYAAWLTLLFMCFMTPLTLYLALFNPVSDCGCFGDALVISNWATFGKNVVLLGAASVLVLWHKRITSFYTYRVYWFVALFSYIYSVGFSLRNYNHLPVVDFRPFKVGANIPRLMEVPEGAAEDEYRYSFIYEKNGVQKEFSLEDAPTEDSTWTFVDSRTELVRQGYVPPIQSFNLFDRQGNDLTDSLLHDSKPLMLLVAYDLGAANDDRIDEINNAYDYALDHGMDFYCVTASDDGAISEWTDDTGAEYPYLRADDTVLKTIIRSNPGLLLLRQGTILAKWHYNDIPSEEDLPSVVERLLADKEVKSKEDRPLATNLLTFAVPLLLVWLYDHLRNRVPERRKAKETNI